MTDADTAPPPHGAAAGAAANPAAPFPGDSELARRCRALDWAATPLGPVEGWPASLRTAAALMLAAPTPMIVLWGPELVQLYNDGYATVMGAKHPAGLGQRNVECWPEVWEFTAPVYAGVRERGEAFTFADQRLVLERRGRPEETFFTLTYSPVFDEAGRVGGVFVTVVETTAQVRARDERALERERLMAESKTAEAALRAREAQYRVLVECIDQGFCIIELLFDAHDAPVDYRFVETNSAFAGQTGLADAVGRRMRELAPAHEAHWFERYGRVAATGQPVRFEALAEALGRWYDVFAFRVGAPDERRVGILFTDVTATKRAEAERARLVAELTAERERLRALIRLMPAPVALHLGPEHRYAVLSDAFRSISGGRDLTGLSPRDAYPEVEGQRILERFDEVVATGRPWVSPETHVRLDRRGMGVEDTWFDIRYEPVRDADGRVVGVLNFSFDVTDQVVARRQVEAHARLLAAKTAELEASQDRLRLALDAAGMAYWDFDPKANTTVRSEHHDRLYGHAEPLAVWNIDTYLARVHPDDRADIAERFRRAIEHDEAWKVESRVVWPDGGVHWIATQGTVFRDGDGTPNRVVGVITDVTARKRAEAERERLLHEAEAARLDAEAANRSKSEFLAVMSHELRTPLNAIGGYAELLELGIRGPVTEQQREDLARIQRSQRHLLGLIAGVLDYSRVEAGAVTYRLTDVPVAEAVAEAEALVAPQLRAKGLGYAWAGAAPGLRVRADREKLQQVLLNLLGNAVKFTHPRDGVAGRVDVSCTADHGAGGGSAGGRVHLHVRDTGQGIADDKLERIFEPFVQVDQRLTRPHEGVGLGLAISRDLARGMGGDLTAESTPGVGSTFTLALPGA